MFFNFSVGTGLSQTHKAQKKKVKLRRHSINRKAVLIVGIAANLSLLGYFKYANFFIDNLNTVFNTGYTLPAILLPLAISFFTFQQIAYLVDSFRGETAEYDLLNYSIFVTFFPQLIAGPIVHHREMMSQFSNPRTWFIKYDNIVKGLFIFSVGLFKKVVIADTFSIWASAGFDGEQALGFFSAWATSLSYTFQLYFDFSGYCDMAIGIALLFNIKLPINFNSPYKALSIQDFWRRWHITLSNFLRDYIYIPLGGSQKKSINTYLNLMVTFALGGLWHGANWMFVIWGVLHGSALIIHRLWRKMGMRMPKAMAWLITFLFVNFAWVFFRATNIDDATRILSGMVSIGSITDKTNVFIPTDNLAWGGWLIDILHNFIPYALASQAMIYLAIIIGFIIIGQKNSLEISTGSYTRSRTVYGALSFTIATYCMMAATSTVFLYFNF